MFLINDEIKNDKAIIIPFNENHVTKIGYILHASETVSVSPGGCYLMSTKETLNIYNHIAPLVFNLSLQNFMIIPDNIQPGYTGQLTITIINPSALTLTIEEDTPLCELRLTTLGRVPC